MHHTNSVGTFNNDAGILWEKRVALDCVGAVRSSEQEHGIHTFEFFAYGCGGPDDDTASTFRGGGAKDEIIDPWGIRISKLHTKWIAKKLRLPSENDAIEILNYYC